MSPILVRPVREQLEHDRVIRLLQAKYKRKFEVAINPGNEQTAPVGAGTPWYPDLVLQSTERGRKLLGVVEVETAESVNNLEAMSQWATFSRLRAVFHLYIPVSAIDTAKRLCADLQIAVAEMWAYSALGDQIRFTLVQRAQGSDGRPRASAPAPPRAEPAAAPRRPASARPATAARAAAPPRRATTARPARRAAASRPRAADSKKTPATRGTARKKTTGSSRAAFAKASTPKTQKRK